MRYVNPVRNGPGQAGRGRLGGMRAWIWIVVLLVGCVAAPLRWSREETTQDEFMDDRYECLREAHGGHVEKGIFVSCMTKRGYVQDPNGPFAPPPGSEVTSRR